MGFAGLKAQGSWQRATAGIIPDAVEIERYIRGREMVNRIKVRDTVAINSSKIVSHGR